MSKIEFIFTIILLMSIPAMWVGSIGMNHADCYRADGSKSSRPMVYAAIWIVSIFVIVVSIIAILCLREINI